MPSEQDKECKGCLDRDRCHEVYAKLSKSRAEPVALKAFTAFFVPLLAFIVMYVLFLNWLSDYVSDEYIELAAVLPSVLSAVVITFLFKYVVSFIFKIKF
ncbi:hypothetical protein SMSP2_00940 [Limihaloglobus sulfuriphilus]|uniref:Positive regulator of sigma(E), RseC/MucC n=1 Tax=Limihaloglobus sulfuriphilus TaxID=1851148 RepID=A0A1Q2ME54_9BACT|nr:hypothetical protein SMSP2_00940 [Limihaloglobus sulfuriphilus]